MGAGASVETNIEPEKLDWLKNPRNTKNVEGPSTENASNGNSMQLSKEIEEVLGELCKKPAVLADIVNVQEGTSLSKMSNADHLAQKGFLPAFEYAKKCGIDLQLTNRAMDFSAGEGHLAVVEWLHHNREEGCTVEAMNTAAKNGHLEVVKWLHNNRQEGCNKDALTFACRHGHLELAEWLHENRSDGCASFTLKAAAMNGHLQLVEWLHKNKTHPNLKGLKIKRGSFVASDNGHDEIANYLIRQEKKPPALTDMDGETQSNMLCNQADAPTPVAGRSHM